MSHLFPVRNAVCLAATCLALFTSAASATEDFEEQRRPNLFARFAGGFGYGFGSNELGGAAGLASFGLGGYANDAFAIHFSGGGTAVSTETNTEVYYYGLGLGVTYFPADHFFGSVSALFGNLQTSRSSDGSFGPGTELMLGWVGGEQATKFGVTLGIIGWAVEPDFSPWLFGATTTVAFTVMRR